MDNQEGNKKKLWKITNSSYDGCTGWSTWDIGKVFENKVDAIIYAREQNKGSFFNRYEVEEVIIN